MNITKSHYVIYIRFMRLGSQRISQENNQINLIMLDLSTDLLLSSQMAGKKFMNIQIGYFLDQPSGRTCCVKIILT